MKLVKQLYDYDCGPACLRMLYLHFRHTPHLKYSEIISIAKCTKDGTEFKDFNHALKELGLLRKRVSEKWIREVNVDPRPYITLIQDPMDSTEDHYIIASRLYQSDYFSIFDPYYGKKRLHYKELLSQIKIQNGHPWVWGIESIRNT